MKKSLRFYLLFLLVSGYAFSLAAKTPTYVGYKKCRGCHRGERRGHVANKWEDSKHARAFEALDEKDRKNPVCLQCHTTGYGRIGNGGYLEGVQCEAGHGPGSEYKHGRIMNARRYKVNRAEQHKKAVGAGLWTPSVKTCRRCHRKNALDFKKNLSDERPLQPQ